MSDFHFIAVLTYGTEKHGNQSDFKIGQGSGADVLLKLFGSRAREFVLPRASYRYVHVDVKGFRTHHNYLVMRVTDEEKVQVEAICRKNGDFVWVYLWEHDGRRWLQFPNTPEARYIDPSSYGGTCPKFPPTHAAFFTSSRVTEESDFAKTNLPPPVPAPSPIPVVRPEPEALDEPDVTPNAHESLMRSVRTDDVTAALVAHIHDSERGKPVLIDFIGSRNAVKQLLSKPFNPAYMGVKADAHAFTVVDGERYTGFRLPDNGYKALTTTLNGRVLEGRIVALDATTSAPRSECYVLVMDRIELPRIELSEPIEETWLRYIRYRQTPNRPEFAGYASPSWAADLYNVYQALRVRIGRPLHERWMPWLFGQVADKAVSSETLGLKAVTLCKYVPGYIDPKAQGVVERGAYRLTCRDLSNLWAEILIRNPNRADRITFGSAK